MDKLDLKVGDLVRLRVQYLVFFEQPTEPDEIEVPAGSVAWVTEVRTHNQYDSLDLLFPAYGHAIGFAPLEAENWEKVDA